MSVLDRSEDKNCFFLQLALLLFHNNYHETSAIIKPKETNYTADYSQRINQSITVIKYLRKYLSSYKIHIISWAIFIPSEVFIVGWATGRFGTPLSYATHYFVNILLFYFCSLKIYPIVFANGISWLWKLPLLASATFAIYLAVNYYIDSNYFEHITIYNLEKVRLQPSYILGVLWRALQFMAFAGFHFLFLLHLEETRQIEQAKHYKWESMVAEKEIQVQLVQARNSYLKAQINPHLLFNTLNFIYTDTLLSSPKAAEAIMTLSEVMRYSVNCEFRSDQLPLKEEIQQVHNLIKLHQTRYEEKLSFIFEVGPNVKETTFIPLVLITIAENIFKHGNFRDHKHPATLSIDIHKGLLSIRSRNLPNKTKLVPSLNKGIKNIEQRLLIAYQDQVEINYGIKSEFFILNINVNLNHPTSNL